MQFNEVEMMLSTVARLIFTSPFLIVGQASAIDWFIHTSAASSIY
jgi:hypothetical protein